MKRLEIHKTVQKELKQLSLTLRREINQLFTSLMLGESLGMPISRPMPSIANGVHELRIKDSTGQYRSFYFSKIQNIIVILHMFKKKTKATPKKEIELVKRRLYEYK